MAAPTVSPLRSVRGGASSLPEGLPPPSSLDAEQSALGSALISASAALYLAENLGRGSFYMETHRRIFEVIASLVQRGEPVDVMSVPEGLRSRDWLDACGGAAYIHTLTETVPTAKHVAHYAAIVAEKAALRDAIDFSGGLVRSAYDGVEMESLLARMDRWLTTNRAQRDAGKGPCPMAAPDLMALDIPPMRWAVEGLLPEGTTLLVAAPKIGKSWAAYQIAIAVATGGMAFSKIKVEQGEALCLMLEDTKRRAKSRIGQLLADSSPPAGLFVMTDCPRMDDGGRMFLESWLAAHPNCRFVVIDTLQKFRTRQSEKGSMYAEDYEAVGAIKKVADRFGVSVLVIHHVNKSRSEDIFDSVSGSNGVAGAADGTLIIGRERGNEDGVLHVTGRDIEERKLALRFDRLTAWELLGDAEEHASTRERDQVLTVLRKAFPRPMKAAEIGQELGLSGSAARARLYRMANASILSVESGWFSLTTKYQTAPNTATPATGATVQNCNSFTGGADWKGDEDPEVVALAAGIAPVAGVAGVATTAQNHALPFVDDPPERSPRTELRLLATEWNFPVLTVTGPQGDAFDLQREEHWHYICQKWPEDTLRQVEAELRRAGP